METTHTSAVPVGALPKISWRAILAGAIAALALQIVLMMLGSAIGLAIYNPTTSDQPFANFGAGAAVIQGLSAVISLWAGGWIAGRFLARGTETLGGLHGFMVWCVTTVTAVAILATGASWALGGISHTLASGLSAAGRPAAAAIASSDPMGGMKETIVSFTSEGLATPPAGMTAAQTIRSTREVTRAVALFVAADAESKPAKQQALTDTLVAIQGMSEVDAKKMVADWTLTADQMKADANAALQAAETKARAMAEETSNTLAVLSGCYFLAFLLGGVFSIGGGRHGAACAHKRHDAVSIHALCNANLT